MIPTVIRGRSAVGVASDKIPGLEIHPPLLYDSILAATAIVDFVLALLNTTGMINLLEASDLIVPLAGFGNLDVQGSSLELTVTTLMALGYSSFDYHYPSSVSADEGQCVWWGALDVSFKCHSGLLNDHNLSTYFFLRGGQYGNV